MCKSCLIRYEYGDLASRLAGRGKGGNVPGVVHWKLNEFFEPLLTYLDIRGGMANKMAHSLISPPA